MKFLEHTHIVNAHPIALMAAAEDMFAAAVESSVINMENAKSCVFFIKCTEGTGSASIVISAVDAFSVAATTAISFKYKIITTADVQGATLESKDLVVSGSDKIFALEVDAAKLAEAGYGYIRMTATPKVDKPLHGSITAFLMGLRSAEDVTPTVLS